MGNAQIGPETYSYSNYEIISQPCENIFFFYKSMIRKIVNNLRN